MRDYNSKALREVENRILKEGILCGKEVGSLEEINEVLACELGYDKETVRKWRYDNSNGPANRETINKMEDILGCSLSGKTEYSEYAKKKINEAYVLMRRHINSCEAEDENRYYEFEEAFDDLRGCIPKEIYDKMKTFNKEKIEPITYDYASVFKDDSWETYFKTINEICDELDKFADEELYAYIVY